MALAATVVLASALTACASNKTVGSASAGGSLASSPTPPASAQAGPTGGTGSGGAGTGSAPPAASTSINPGGPVQGGQLASPEAQANALPAGAKYVVIEQIGRSADGRTLYLETMAQAGACGRYVVVVQETPSQVSVGLAHLPVKVGVMCPMLVRIADFPAKLAAPLGNRPVIDLATGKSAGTVGVIPLPLPGSGNSGGTLNQ